MSTCRIRRATPADAPSIARIREETIRTVVAPLGQYTPQEIDAWASNYSADMVLRFMSEATLYVAVDDHDAVLGFGRFRVDENKEAVIQGVFVDAAHVGRGVGSVVLRQLLNDIDSLGVQVTNITATLNARSFYERHGFVALEHIRHESPTGADIPAIRMRREGLRSKDSSAAP